MRQFQTLNRKLDMLAEALVARGADAIIAGKMIHAGQTCIAPDYILLPNAKIEEFAAAAALRGRVVFQNSGAHPL